jgi:hypothetical protein
MIKLYKLSDFYGEFYLNKIGKEFRKKVEATKGIVCSTNICRLPARTSYGR